VPALLEQNAREAAARGVGRFLSHHERCGSGFGIARNGRGRLHVVCGGCGERSRYGAMDTDQLRADGVDLGEVATGRRFGRSRAGAEQWLPAPPALPWWVPNAYIVGVILIGLGLVTFGLVGPREGEGPAPSDRPPADTVPSQAPPADSAPSPATAGALGSGDAARPPQAPSPGRAQPDLRRIVVLGRFAIGVPEGWGGGISGGAVVFRAPSGDAELRVFLEPGTVEPRRLHDEAASFLARERPGARIRRQTPGALGKLPAVRLVARHRTGEHRAALVSARGYTYFVIAGVERGASKWAKAASVAALRSFRPR
jgi:hypothetical protein